MDLRFAHENGEQVIYKRGYTGGNKETREMPKGHRNMGIYGKNIKGTGALNYVGFITAKFCYSCGSQVASNLYLDF